MALQQLHNGIQEARTAYKVSRREAEILLNCGNRVLEGYEYGRAKTPTDVYTGAAKHFKSPELLDLAYGDYPLEWPRVPLPNRIEDSLLANAAKSAKEAQENSDAMKKLVHDVYGKVSAEDLSQMDRQLITEALVEGAEAVRAFKKFCLTLVKQYGFGTEEINKIIAQRLGQSKPAMRAVK